MRLTHLAMLLSIATSMVSVTAGYGFASNTNSPISHNRALDTNNDQTEANNTNSGDENLTQFVISLKLQHEDELQQLIKDQNDPKSPQFLKYLSVSQFVDRFSPSTQQYVELADYLSKNGLNVIGLTPNHLLIEAEGTNDQLKKLFGSVNDIYGVTSTADSDTKSIQMPDNLKSLIQTVQFRSESTNYHSHLNYKPYADGNPRLPPGFAPGPIATVYNYPNSNNNNGNSKTLSGHGVTIAIASAYNYSPDDVNNFWNLFGINRTGSIKNIYIDGRPRQSKLETTIDLEQVGAQAPGANILMYIAKEPSSLDFALMFNKIVTDNVADVISHSWGAAEKIENPTSMITEHQIFEEASVQGIAIFSASGDSGAYDVPTLTPFGPRPSMIMSADYPSSDPNVTGVGGTTLVLNRDGSRDIEDAWHGSGGGISGVFTKPWWQVGPGIDSNSYRNSADVALNADEATGYTLVYNNHVGVAGGTSFAAPNWAAGWGLAEEEIGHRIAMPNIYIYKIANSKAYNDVFYNVTAGNNGMQMGPGYPAHEGFNHPTGWGTPNFGNLIVWLNGYINSPNNNDTSGTQTTKQSQ